MTLKRVSRGSPSRFHWLLVLALFVGLLAFGQRLWRSRRGTASRPMKAIVRWHYGTADVLRLERSRRGAGRRRDPREGSRSLPSIPSTGTRCAARVLMRLGERAAHSRRTSASASTSRGLVRTFAGKRSRASRLATRCSAVDPAPSRYVVGDPIAQSRPSRRNVSFEQGPTAGVAAVTALQALRDAGPAAVGRERVLVNGAVGGVGTYSPCRSAKSMGAEVTGVSSTRNLELVASSRRSRHHYTVRILGRVGGCTT